MYASSHLQRGEIYTRKELQELFNISDQTLYTGVFRPAGYNSIWLFVTERKAPDMTGYSDLLDENILYWDGQTSGRTDSLIIGHMQAGLEVLVFYRAKKLAFAGAGFRYEGRFRYSSHVGAKPAHFVLQRVV